MEDKITKRITVGILACTMFILTSCSPEMMQSLGELTKLQKGIAAQFNEKIVSVNLMNKKHLTISIVNTPINKLPKAEKESKVKEIALWVKSNYSNSSQLESIGVTLEIQKRILFISTKYTQTYKYSISELHETEISM